MSSLGPPIQAGRAAVSGRGFGLAAVNVAYCFAALVAVVWAYFTFEWGFNSDVIGFDFEGTLWDAGIAIREGRSPYPSPIAEELEVGNPALYPPLLMVLVAPLTVLPWSIGVALWTLLLGAAVAAALYVLDVRDPRCYLLALIGQFTVFGLVFGNATLLLVPLVALAWRWRNQWARAGIVVGVAIAAKLFLWPLLFWLLGTRRYRAFATGVLALLLAVFLPWALIGFDGLREYPDLLRTAEAVFAGQGYSIAAMVSALGADIEAAARVSFAAGAVLAVAAFAAGRRGADTAAIALAVIAAILGSPIVWPYYFALLIVPVAIARPRFSGLWVALTLFYASNLLSRELLSEEELRAQGICCRPEDTPLVAWSVTHSPPAPWHALAYTMLGAALVGAVIWAARRQNAVSSEAAGG